MKNIKTKATMIMLICAIFLFVKYIAQLFPSLIGQDLMTHYALTGLQLGILASSYYYSYSIMQLGSGILLDRFSIRFIAFAAILVMAISLYFFSETHSFVIMCLSRVLMGLAASFATVLYMKCASIWTNKKSFGFISSLLATATMLGAAAGGAPLSYLFSLDGWRHGIQHIGLISLGLSLLCLLVISRNHEQPDSLATEKQKVTHVLFNKQNWILMLYSGFVFSPIVIMGGLWGMPFIKLKYHLSTHVVSYLLSIMFIGLAVGAPIWTYFSGYFNNRKSLMHFSNLMSFVCLCLIIYANVSYTTAIFLFFILGFSVGCFMISFSICKELNPFVLLGLAFAFINMGEGIVGSVIEPAIGWMLDLLSPLHSAFTMTAFHESLSLLPLCFILAAFLLQKINTEPAQVEETQINAVGLT